jgi:hypothetical protein
MPFPLCFTAAKPFVNGCASLFVNQSASVSGNVFVSAFVNEAASLFLNGISMRLRDARSHQAPMKTKGARGVVDVTRAFTRAAALCGSRHLDAGRYKRRQWWQGHRTIEPASRSRR